MSLPFKDIAAFGNLRSVAFGSITSSYVAFGSALATPVVVVAFKNNTNGIILVSTDGTNDKLVYPGLSYGVYDLRTNAPEGDPFYLPQALQFYVKYSGSAPTSGSFYMESVVLTKAT